jgi:hypothetical protein
VADAGAGELEERHRQLARSCLTDLRRRATRNVYERRTEKYWGSRDRQRPEGEAAATSTPITYRIIKDEATRLDGASSTGKVDIHGSWFGWEEHGEPEKGGAGS